MSLRRCPFCGKKAMPVSMESLYTGFIVYVECTNCGARTKVFRAQADPSKTDYTDLPSRQAKKAWNRRRGEEEPEE